MVGRAGATMDMSRAAVKTHSMRELTTARRLLLGSAASCSSVSQCGAASLLPWSGGCGGRRPEALFSVADGEAGAVWERGGGGAPAGDAGGGEEMVMTAGGAGERCPCGTTLEALMEKKEGE